MGVYYNKSQGPVPVTLSGGRAALIPAKGRDVFTGEDESAPSLLAAVATGLLVRLPDKLAGTPPSPSVTAPVPVPVATALQESAVVLTAGVAAPSVSASTSASMESPTVPTELSLDVTPDVAADAVPTVDDGTASTAIAVTDPGTRDGKRHRRQ